MKKALLILACAAIAGCGNPTAKDGTTIDEVWCLSIQVRKVRGHDYLVAAYNGCGVSVVHAASCPCLKPRNYTIEDLVTTNRLQDIRYYIEEASRAYIEKAVK